MKSLFYNCGEIKTEKEAKIDTIGYIERDSRLDDELIELGFDGEYELDEDILTTNETIYNLYCSEYDYAINHQLAYNDIIIDYDTNIRDAIFLVCNSFRNRNCGEIEYIMSQSMSLSCFNDYPTISVPLDVIPLETFTDILKYLNIDFTLRYVDFDDNESVYVIFNDLDGKRTTLEF